MEANLSSLLEPTIIPVWLRNTYGCIHPTPIYNLDGPLRQSLGNQELVRDLLSKGIEASGLFLSGETLFGYLNLVLSDNAMSICNYTVTIVITNLRDLYWNNRHILPQDIVVELELAMKTVLPKFKNVFEYLQETNNLPNVALYQMFGTVTPFSVLHIPVNYFIEALNNKVPLQVSLEHTNVTIQLDYEKYDFWDRITDSLVEYIDLQAVCEV